MPLLEMAEALRKLQEAEPDYFSEVFPPDMAWRVDRPGARARSSSTRRLSRASCRRSGRSARRRFGSISGSQSRWPARGRLDGGTRAAVRRGRWGAVAATTHPHQARPHSDRGVSASFAPPGHVEAVAPFPGEPVEAGDLDPGPAAPDVARRIPQGVQATGGARGRGGSASGERVHCVHVP